MTGRTLIAASRERVWAKMRLQRASSLPPVHDVGLWRGIDIGATMRRLRALGLSVEEQVVACVTPQRYAYQFVCPRLFRTYRGEIVLREHRRTTTEVAWAVEFELRVPLTGWLARFLFDRLLDRALLGLKRDLETVAALR